MKILKRIFMIIEFIALLIIWGVGFIFGWIITGKDVMENTAVNKKLNKLLEL